MLKLVDYILVYGARRLFMLDGDSLIVIDVMKVDFTTCKSDVWLTVHRNSMWIKKTN
jgi:hypothetical protein